MTRAVSRKATPRRDPMLPYGSPKCQCAACGKYFTSPYAFDEHRLTPKGDGIRRCLSGDEMAARGFIRKPSGHWTSAANHRAHGEWRPRGAEISPTRPPGSGPAGRPESSRSAREVRL
jgi:hypothetical protein